MENNMNLNKNTACTVTAGFASRDITPALGVHLGGGTPGAYRPTRFVKSPLYAKASIFKADKTVCTVELDVLIISKKYCDKIKSKIGERLGLPYEAIMVFSVQAHTAPFVGDCMLDPDFPLEIKKDKEFLTGNITDYSEMVCERAAEAAEEAYGNLRPLKMDVKSGTLHGLAHCRRIIKRDNTMVMFSNITKKQNPLGPEISHLESPVDDEVGVVCFKDGTELVGSMLHFTCHPVNDYCSRVYYNAASPDWCGAWAKGMKDRLGIKNVPSVLNGCCGNVNPHDPYEPDFFPDSDRMGKALTDLSERIILSMSFEGEDTPAVVDYRYAEIPMDYGEMTAEWQKKVIDTIEGGPVRREENGDFEYEWSMAASSYSTLCIKRREPRFMYPVQVFRIGSLAIVALAGEPFTDTQLDLKLKSKAPMTYVTHCANRYVGYLPPIKGFAYDGHESNFKRTYWAKLAPGSIERAEEAALCQIEEMF